MDKIIVFIILYSVFIANQKYISISDYSTYLEYPSIENDTILHDNLGTKYWRIQDSLYIIGIDTADYKYQKSYLMYEAKLNDTLTRYDPMSYEPKYEIVDTYEVQRHGTWTYRKGSKLLTYEYKNDKLMSHSVVEKNIKKK